MDAMTTTIDLVPVTVYVPQTTRDALHRLKRFNDQKRRTESLGDVVQRLASEATGTA